MMEENKTGLVIEGGGMRGIYAAGVLDSFLLAKLQFDGVVGVSAGAIHGASFVSKQFGRSIRYTTRFCRDDRFMSVKNFIKTGNFVGTQFCYHDIPDRLDPYDEETFEQSKTNFYVVCSNVESGQPEYFHLTDLRREIDLLQASASLPYLSTIVQWDGKKLLDGGCTDAIPLKASQNLGYGRNVVILTRSIQDIKSDRDAYLVPLIYRKYPNFVRAFRRSAKKYYETLEYIQKEKESGSVFVVRPARSIRIPRLTRDPKVIQSIYDVGRQDGQNAIEALRNWMAQR